MKRKIFLVLILIGVLMSSLPMVNAQEIDTVLENRLTDNLTSKEDIKWYSFEMIEDGDAIIIVTGLQDHWDGYPYHWQCAIYEDDQESVMVYDNVRGYAENDGPSIISAPELTAGTYYIRMTSTNSANPLMTAFTSDSYELQLLRYYNSESAVYDGEGIQTFDSAWDILWAVDGTAFLKLNDGECFMALMKNENLAIVPVLISTDKDAVEYIVSSTGERITARGPFHHDDSDLDYYYSDCNGIDKYTNKNHKLPIVEVDNASMVADKMLEEEMGTFSYLWMKCKDIVYGLLGLVFFLIIFALFFGGGGGSKSDGDASGSLYEALVEAWTDGL